MNDKAIVLKGIRKAFAGHVAVKDLSLEVPRGSVFGLLGPNGAGKTTTLRMVLNILGPDAGSIEILGKPADRDHAVLAAASNDCQKKTSPRTSSVGTPTLIVRCDELVTNASAATSIQQQQATTRMAMAMIIHLMVLSPFLVVVSGTHVAGGMEFESLNCDMSGTRAPGVSGCSS